VRPDWGPFSHLAIVASVSICLAVAIALPAWVAWYGVGSYTYDWPGWLTTGFMLGIPIGVVSLVLVLVARHRIIAAHVRLRGSSLVSIALLTALVGFSLTFFIGYVEAMSNSM
jgi:hypothetical protein